MIEPESTSRRSNGQNSFRYLASKIIQRLYCKNKHIYKFIVRLGWIMGKIQLFYIQRCETIVWTMISGIKKKSVFCLKVYGVVYLFDCSLINLHSYVELQCKNCKILIMSRLKNYVYFDCKIKKGLITINA